MLSMRLIGTIGALLLLILTQSGLAYSATAMLCSTSIPGNPDRHCCAMNHRATSPSDPCQDRCELESKDIPVTPRTASIKAYATDAAFDLALVETHRVWLPVEQKPWSGSPAFSALDSRVEVYLLNAAFLI